MNIGERIKARRIELGMTQEELAKKMGYTTRNAVYQFEQKDNMKLSIVEKFAKALDVSEAYLMGWEDDEQLDYYDKLFQAYADGMLLAQMQDDTMFMEEIKKLFSLPDETKLFIYNQIDFLICQEQKKLQDNQE